MFTVEQIEQQPQLKIVIKQVSDITPYTRNPRRNERTVETLKKSISKYGFKNPVILDEQDVIVAGHARVKAAIMLGIQTVPCVYAYDLTPAQIQAYRITDNKTAEIAGWDYDKLAGEMQALADNAFDMDDTGFNEMEQLDYGDMDAKPSKVDRTEFKDDSEYAQENILQSFNVAILCNTEAEKDRLRELFCEENGLRRLYRAEELIRMTRATA